MDRRLPERDQSALQILDGSHLTEDALEVYSLGRLSSEEDIAVVEEHILVCGYCQTRLEKMDGFVAAAVAGAKSVAADPAPDKSRNYLPIAIAASAALLVFLPGVFEQNNQQTSIDLVAVRNENKLTAPAHTSLNLKLDLTGLSATAYDWELSGIDGKVQSSGKLDLSSGRLVISGLDAGQYWLRLKTAGQQEILREFSLLVK
jgi:hypothetical protein